MAVLDTSALIYWTLDPDKLSEPARETLAQTDQFVISSISIWEIGVKVSKNLLSIPYRLMITLIIYARYKASKFARRCRDMARQSRTRLVAS